MKVWNVPTVTELDVLFTQGGQTGNTEKQTTQMQKAFDASNPPKNYTPGGYEDPSNVN